MWGMNDEPRKQPGHTVHPRLSDELHDRLTAWAARERRSLNQSVALLLEQALDADSAGDGR